jgi:energy-coupling factor transport system ATP-binding protein
MSDVVPRLQMIDASVRYPARQGAALDGVQLELHAGDALGVTGRTGAGASTLALLAGGFIPRVVAATTSGSTVIDGLDVTGSAGSGADPAALLGRVGIVFSTPANQLSASKPTVREELAFGLENMAVPRAAMDPRIDDVMERLGIGHLADRDPAVLSGGEQQRVAVAAIVVMGPGLVVLDEPTAQLDPAGTTDVAALLRSLATDGHTILCVERDPVVLAGLDRVAVLAEGRVIGTDAPGVALGRGLAGSAGLPSPDLVRLAEIGGVDPALAFDVASVATGLRAASSGLRVPSGHGQVQHDQPDPTPDLGAVDGRPGAAIDVVDVVHRYPDGTAALRGVSLRIEPGETVAIVGQNGSGKTTLIKHLNGLLRPTAGAVCLDGSSIEDTPIHRLAARVGLAFQDPADQLFERSVEREVMFGPRNLGYEPNRTQALVEHAIAAVGLADDRTTNPYDLDMARRKLVALASVLAMDPAILVLDEPTTGQDGPGIARVRAIVRAWQARGRTVIAVTHDMAFAATTFDRVVVMRGGEIVDDGHPTRVLSAANAPTLAATGLTPPPVALVAEALGVSPARLTIDGLLAALSGP